MIRRFVFVFLVLCLPSLAFGQKFNNVVDGSLYPPTGNHIIPPSGGDYAILAWSHVPSTVSGSIEILSVDIIPSVDGVGKASSAYGWYHTDSDTDIRHWWSIIDSSTLYARSGNGVPNWLLDRIQSKLVEKNLGTVQQRAAYIAGFKVKDVNIIDTSSILASFKELLGPWANIAVGLMIALFALEFGTRNTKQLAGDAAREVSKAEKWALKDEIKNDKYAQVFEARMKLFAQASRDYLASTEFRRESREWLEQTASDYAKYKKSRGWTV